MSENCLTIRNLQKTYASGVQALKSVNLELSAEMFGLLGANGAGKTTLMKILATLLQPDTGTVEINGIDLLTDKIAARRLLGYLPQEFGFYPTFTAAQMLSYLAALKGIADKKERKMLVDAMLEKVNLSSVKKQRVGEFSGGMRQRLGIAQALIGKPKLLIVDEPTAGLDPEERARFHNLLAELTTDVIVLLSTHIVSDVANLCNRMAIIRRGEIIVVCTPTDAIKRMADCIWEATIERDSVPEWQSRCQIISSQFIDGKVRLRVLAERIRPGEIFIPAIPTLEDYYFNLVNQPMGMT
jgi:ABC-type multidrug transport system ATPase subunit